MKISNRELFFIGVFLLAVLAALWLDASQSILTTRDYMVTAREMPWRLTVREWLWEPVVEEIIFRGPLWLFLMAWPGISWRNPILWGLVAASTYVWVADHVFFCPWTTVVLGVGICVLLIVVHKSEFSRREAIAFVGARRNLWSWLKPLVFVIIAHQSFNIFSTTFSYILN